MKEWCKQCDSTTTRRCSGINRLWTAWRSTLQQVRPPTVPTGRCRPTRLVQTGHAVPLASVCVCVNLRACVCVCVCVHAAQVAARTNLTAFDLASPFIWQVLENRGVIAAMVNRSDANHLTALTGELTHNRTTLAVASAPALPPLTPSLPLTAPAPAAVLHRHRRSPDVLRRRRPARHTQGERAAAATPNPPDCHTRARRRWNGRSTTSCPFLCTCRCPP